MSDSTPPPPHSESAAHVERLKAQRVSTFTSATAAPGVKAPEGAVLLDLPGVTDRLRYARAYWSATVRNLLVAHRVQVSGVTTHAATAHITPALRTRWERLFSESSPGAVPEVPVPYLFNQSVGTLLYTRLIAQLGINFRNLLHVQHETKHWANVSDWISTDQQDLYASLRSASRLGDGKAMIAFRIAIHRPQRDGGALLGTVNDRFIIRNVPEADLEQLASGRALLRTLAELRRKDPQLDPTASDSVTATIRLPMDMGKQFGRVSGDFNPVHTTALAARLFGVKRPFLQGLGLRNAMMRQLALHGRPLTRFAISFATPAFLGQTLRVVMQGDAFELIDEGGQVVAFGAGNATT